MASVSQKVERQGPSMTSYTVARDIASSGIVLSGGDELTVNVLGGVANFTVVSSGGFANVSAGGTASGTILSGARRQLSSMRGNRRSDGRARRRRRVRLFRWCGSVRRRLAAAASEYVYTGGLPSLTVVNGGGTEFVYTKRGVALGTKILGGGSGAVFNGGVASLTVISGGGVVKQYFRAVSPFPLSWKVVARSRCSAAVSLGPR